MSPQAQRLAIAKACPDLFTVVELRPGRTLVYWKASFEESGIEAEAVDLLNDINAVQEVVKACIKNEEMSVVYLSYLHEAVLGYLNDYDDEPSIWHKDVFKIAHALADKRLQALVKYLNLWDDSL